MIVESCASTEASPPVAPAQRLPAVAVVARTADGDRELVVDAAASATIGDVASVLLGEAGPLEVDGALVEAQVPISASGMREGSFVARPGRPQGADDQPVVELRWVRGVDAGRIDRLGPGSWVVGTSPHASLCRADAGAPQAAIVHVSTHGGVTVEELVAGVAALGPAGHATDSADRALRIGGGEALVRALSGPPDGSCMTTRPAALPGQWTSPVIRRAGRAVLQADEPQAPSTEAPLAKPGGPSLLPPLLSLGAGVVLAVVAHQPMLLILGGVGAIGSLGTWAWHRVRHAVARRRQRRDQAEGRRRHDAAHAAWRAATRSALEERFPDLAVVADRIARGSSTLWSGRTSPGSALVLAVGDGRAGPLLVELAAWGGARAGRTVGGHPGRRPRPGASYGRSSRTGRPRDRCHRRRPRALAMDGLAAAHRRSARRSRHGRAGRRRPARGCGHAP